MEKPALDAHERGDTTGLRKAETRLLTSPEEVDKTLQAVGELTRGMATSRFPSRHVATNG